MLTKLVSGKQRMPMGSLEVVRTGVTSDNNLQNKFDNALARAAINK